MQNLEEDIYSMIIENSEEMADILKQETRLKKIHCNGCSNQCKLSNPQCGRGMALKRRIETME